MLNKIPSLPPTKPIYVAAGIFRNTRSQRTSIRDCQFNQALKMDPNYALAYAAWAKLT